MVLLRELLDHQVVERRHLLGEALGRDEPLSEEHDLDDEIDVGRHHRHRAQQRFEVLGQLGTAGVARVHRDKDAAGRVEGDLAPLEHEARHALRDRIQDGQDLLRHDGEHFHLDTVELVEARPGARLRQAREHAAERLVVKAIGAVEDDALLREVLGQILDGLCLTGTGRALWQAAAVQVQRRRERGVAAVGQWRDDEARGVAEVLVAVEGARVRLLDDAALGA